MTIDIDRASHGMAPVIRLLGADDAVLASNDDGDRLDGGAGRDMADYRAAPNAVTVDLAGGRASAGAHGIDTLVSIEGAYGTGFNDTFVAGAGNDLLRGAGGNDVLDGGAGVDTALYASARRMYVANSTSFTGAGEGTDTLISIENLRFVDGTLTFDAASQAAQVMRMYDAALARQSDQAGFENWLDRLETGTSLTQMAQAFLNSAEFQSKFGGLSNQDYVAQLYRTTLRREPDPGGLAAWTARLDSGMSRTDMLVAFSESAEHVRLTAGLWLGGIQVSGGHNSALAVAEPQKSLDAAEAFRDPGVVHDPLDDDAFVLAADIDLTAQVMPTLDGHKAPAPETAAVETLPPAWFDAPHLADAGPDLADLHRIPANDFDHIRQTQDHAWVV